MAVERLTNQPSGQLIASKVIEVLEHLTFAVGIMGNQVAKMPGAERRRMKECEAHVLEAGKMLGMFDPDMTVEWPTSAWPEGEGS